MKKLYITVKGAFPSYAQLSSTWQENVYAVLADEKLEEKLRDDPNVKVLKYEPIILA